VPVSIEKKTDLELPRISRTYQSLVMVTTKFVVSNGLLI